MSPYLCLPVVGASLIRKYLCLTSIHHRKRKRPWCFWNSTFALGVYFSSLYFIGGWTENVYMHVCVIYICVCVWHTYIHIYIYVCVCVWYIYVCVMRMWYICGYIVSVSKVRLGLYSVWYVMGLCYLCIGAAGLSLSVWHRWCVAYVYLCMCEWEYLLKQLKVLSGPRLLNWRLNSSHGQSTLQKRL